MGDAQLTFDRNGYLLPYDIVPVEWGVFVRDFGNNPHRKNILTAYESFLAILGKLLQVNHRQWIDGSFISQKQDPGDIDVIIFVPHTHFSSITSELRQLKNNVEGLADCYFVEHFFLTILSMKLDGQMNLTGIIFYVPTAENDQKAVLNFCLTMEIKDELEIQIFHTLEQVKRMNEAIRRHQRTDDPNAFMIEQFQEVKNRLTNELQVLLSQATETHWQVAA